MVWYNDQPLSSFGARKELRGRPRGNGEQRIPRGTALGNYRVDELIGVGGFGEVYQAHNLTIQQTVAVKVYFVDDKVALAAFTRGASLLAQLKHPNVITLHGFFIQGSLAVAVMELLDPFSTLRRVVGGFETLASVKSVLPLLTGLIQAMRYCHNTRFRDSEGRESIGIYHGDIKPDNVFIRNGEPIVSDFMIPNLEEFLIRRRRGECFPYTDTRVYGTPMYMSPEQLRGKVSEQSDIYSFGVTAFEVLTGFYPYESEDDFKAHKFQLIERFNPYCPPWLSRIVHKCISHDLRTRYQHAAEVERALRAQALGQQGELAMSVDPITIMSAIASGLGLVDKFVDLVRKVRKGEDRPHRVDAKQEGGALVIKRGGDVVERIQANQLRLNEWDGPRFEALRKRVASLWNQYNGLYAQLPNLSVDEQLRLQQRMEQMRKDLCGDFREMVGISEQVLGVGLDDHYSLYQTCSDSSV